MHLAFLFHANLSAAPVKAPEQGVKECKVLQPIPRRKQTDAFETVNFLAHLAVTASSAALFLIKVLPERVSRAHLH
jgi:hypothetical protein